MKRQPVIRALDTQVTGAKCPCGNIFMLTLDQISAMLVEQQPPLQCTCGRTFHITPLGRLTFIWQHKRKKSHTNNK